MKSTKISITLFLAFALLFAQTGSVFAAPTLQGGDVIDGTVTALECVTADGATILVTYDDINGVSQQTEIDLETAINLGLVTIGEGDVPDCSPEAFQTIIDSLSEDVPQHPVGAALSTFFAEIADYDAIMSAHEDGTGFGVLAQALWLTMKMEGDSDTFLAIVQAKKDKDFSAFTLADGATPQNWGQFKKAVLNGDKKANLGVVMSGKEKEDKTNNGNGQEKEKTNNGNGQDKNKNK